jgi:hypothetical protein
MVLTYLTLKGQIHRQNEFQWISINKWFINSGHGQEVKDSSCKTIIVPKQSCNYQKHCTFRCCENPGLCCANKLWGASVQGLGVKIGNQRMIERVLPALSRPPWSIFIWGNTPRSYRSTRRTQYRVLTRYSFEGIGFYLQQTLSYSVSNPRVHNRVRL